MKAGRDAYVEKPLANTMEDARAIRKAVKDTGRIVQIGTQRRSTPNYQRANDFIKSGEVRRHRHGRDDLERQPARALATARSWCRQLRRRGHRLEPLPDQPARRCPSTRGKHLEFRLFWPYSSGIPDQWMVHQIDTVHWFTGLPHPRSVVANGGIYQWHDGRKNFDTMTAVFDYGPLDDPIEGASRSSTRRA